MNACASIALTAFGFLSVQLAHLLLDIVPGLPLGLAAYGAGSGAAIIGTIGLALNVSDWLADLAKLLR